MNEHKAWIKAGMDEAVFMMVGSLQPNLGGCILAHNVDRKSLETRLNKDPFVIEDIVYTDIHEVTPAKANKELHFLMEGNSGN
ncbi:YciI family protein [Pseudoteredinibacter isoporae]|uniref:YciI family protein n=1 Tax=Pseudoteredinibacter isoporae TaxID=570281 RepID=UPI0033413981